MNGKTLRYLGNIPLLLILTACASKPVVDTYHVNMEKYAQDLAECEHVAEQLETGKTIAKSATLGAGVGAVIGAIDGDIGEGAAVGGVSGGTAGIIKSDKERARVIKNCLRHRGYKVLN
jgi:outer membrane lipoprotein SlyB